MFVSGDIEIQLLRAKLEQTEKTLERVLAQMAGINMPNLRQQPKKKVSSCYSVQSCLLYMADHAFKTYLISFVLSNLDMILTSLNDIIMCFRNLRNPQQKEALMILRRKETLNMKNNK